MSLAPEWDHNMVLTWSGRWHIVDVHDAARLGLVAKTERRALCGAYGYTKDTVPKSNLRLLSIKTGAKTAPTCKKCEKAARK